jgi:serine/threonine protein phosphatase PrpC
LRSAKLLGHQHHVLDAVAAVTEGSAAITLSRGGARKTYSYTDPNEDAVCFAFGSHGTLAAVADGHHGARGAERAIEWLLRSPAPEWTEQSESHSSDAWRERARAALQTIHRELIDQGSELGVAPAPSTFSLALVRPEEGLIVHASVGDSHVFRVSAEKSHDLGWASTGKRRCFFAGDSYAGGVLEESFCVVDCEPLADTRAVVLASDGLSELRIGVEDPPAAAASAVEHAASCQPALRALEAGRHLTETALEAHRRNASGDNICAAVIWLET